MKDDRVAPALELAGRAAGRSGAQYTTDAIGEGLAGVVQAVLAATAAPQVWLEVSMDGQSPMLVRREEIAGVRVHTLPEVPGEKIENPHVLEVFVRGLSDPANWLQVTRGATAWFQWNAAESLLQVLEKEFRDDMGYDCPAIFVSVQGEEAGTLLTDRNW